MGELNKLDFLTCAAVSVSIICLAVTGYMQYEIKDSINLLRDAAETRQYNAEISDETQANLENTQAPAVEETTVQTTAVIESTTAAKTEKSDFTVYNSSVPKAKNSSGGGQKTTLRQAAQKAEKEPQLDTVFVYSKNSKKLHSRTCPYADRIKEENKMTINDYELQEFLDNGYSFCSHCQGYITED